MSSFLSRYLSVEQQSPTERRLRDRLTLSPITSQCHKVLRRVELRLEHIKKDTRCENFYALIFAEVEEELIAADQKIQIPPDLVVKSQTIDIVEVI